MCNHILFEYNGVSCGIDPISSTHFDMWYGDKTYIAKSLECVMNATVFDGKTLKEIAYYIENLEL